MANIQKKGGESLLQPTNSAFIPLMKLGVEGGLGGGSIVIGITVFLSVIWPSPLTFFIPPVCSPLGFPGVFSPLGF